MGPIVCATKRARTPRRCSRAARPSTTPPSRRQCSHSLISTLLHTWRMHMSNPDLRDFYDRYIAALNARNFDVLVEFIHDEVTLNGKPATRADILAVLRDEA